MTGEEVLRRKIPGSDERKFTSSPPTLEMTIGGEDDNRKKSYMILVFLSGLLCRFQEFSSQ